MLRRHLDVPAGTPVHEFGPALVDDLLERGDLDHWGPIAREIRADPFGHLAQLVLDVCASNPQYGTSVLWTTWIDGLRHRLKLAEIRRRRRLTQIAIADELGISQSDVSKLEHRQDVRVSTLRDYVRATGGELSLRVTYGTSSFEVVLGVPAWAPDKT